MAARPRQQAANPPVGTALSRPPETAGNEPACRDGSQPSASPRSEEATGNRQQATERGSGTGDGRTGPSTPLRCAQDDNHGAVSAVGAVIGRPPETAGSEPACRDGSQPSASPRSEEATGNRQQSEEPGTGDGRTGPSTPLRCAQDDNHGAVSAVGAVIGRPPETAGSEPACRDGSQPSASPRSEQATGSRAGNWEPGTGERVSFLIPYYLFLCFGERRALDKRPYGGCGRGARGVEDAAPYGRS